MLAPWWIALLLGLTEGVTELLPLSSSAHLLLIASAVGFSGPTATSCQIVIQLGAITAVLHYFRRECLELATNNPLLQRLIPKQTATINPTASLPFSSGHIVLAMLPASLLGLLLHGPITEKLFTTQTLPYGILAGTLLLWCAHRKEQPRITAPNKQTERLTYRQAFCIGLFQCFALWPGFSRSGATIAGALLLNVPRSTALLFSFLLAIPMLLGATSLALLKQAHCFSPSNVPFLVIGVAAAFFSALLLIKRFFTMLYSISWMPFILYRLALAALVTCKVHLGSC